MYAKTEIRILKRKRCPREGRKPLSVNLYGEKSSVSWKTAGFPEIRTKK
jgi:hypothetical protein